MAGNMESEKQEYGNQDSGIWKPDTEIQKSKKTSSSSHKTLCCTVLARKNKGAILKIASPNFTSFETRIPPLLKFIQSLYLAKGMVLRI